MLVGALLENGISYVTPEPRSCNQTGLYVEFVDKAYPFELRVIQGFCSSRASVLREADKR